MKAAYLTDIRTVEIRDAGEPKLENPGDVLLSIEAVGVCGSDMHYYRTGRIGDQVVTFPWLVGHECSARVEKVGEGVDRVKPGDRVAVDPLVWCQECDQCLSGRVHTCRNQVFLGCPGQLEGCLAERLVMPQESLFRVPEDMDAERAALVEPFSIGLYAQKLAAEDLAGRRIGILGCGPIGLCVLAACRAAGAEKVYMTDIRDNRAQLALEMGASWVGNPEKGDVVGDVSELQPAGLDFLFECAGEQETVDQCIDLAKPGGKVLLVGIPEVDRISFRMDTVRRHELTLQPVRRQNHCVQPAIDMIARGEVDLDPMLTHRYEISQTQEAVDTIADYRDGAV
ncbi:MAG: zinc-dependent alcohol dehydrogenase, partial [Planctomycetota bacterium]